MKLNDLQWRLSFEQISYGTWRVFLSLSGGRYCTGISHNSLAVDRINSYVPYRTSLYGYTLKQAYCALLSSVVRERIFKNPKI